MGKDSKVVCLYCGKKMKRTCKHLGMTLLCPHKEDSLWLRITGILCTVRMYLKRKLTRSIND